MLDWEFYRGKKVLVTGHTGFKGTWMCTVLLRAGAEVIGYALKPPTSPSIFEITDMEHKMDSVTGDIRDLAHLRDVFERVRPEIVIHMAAQPIVRESYRNPVYTYETNVMGTVNVLECVRLCPSVRSFINVTTDKVYLNREWAWGYRENEELNGYDPYSNSKSCSELVTSCYKNSFFLNDTDDRIVAISTVRAGNVIGGGDFSIDRIIPDCVRAVMAKREIVVRNPYSVRPYQHVLEPIMAYLLIAQKQYEDIQFAGNYNVGPEDADCCTTGELVTLFCDQWDRFTGDKVNWKNVADESLHEANYLKLDCSKLKMIFQWKPIWNVGQAVEKVIEWTVAYQKAGDIYQIMNRQISEFVK
ncbi:MAG: CDP-glucose 4,6-dehydratase [Lachnospiraceae bacterium]|nr:CDP-glucose 4,6-dehydratase [Lachnospiraceae bacterium]